MADPALEQIEDRQAKAHSARPSSFWGPERETRSITPSKIGSTKYCGPFDNGWDVARERILARQKSFGFVARRGGQPAFPTHISISTLTKPGPGARGPLLGRLEKVRSWRETNLEQTSNTRLENAILEILKRPRVRRKAGRTLPASVPCPRHRRHRQARYDCSVVDSQRQALRPCALK